MPLVRARALLYSDAVWRKEDGKSLVEWEERIERVPHLREAAELLGPRAIEAIVWLVWQIGRQKKQPIPKP